MNTCEIFSKYAESKYDIIIGNALVEGGKIDLSHIETNKTMTGSEYLISAYESRKAPMAAWLNIYNRGFLVLNNLKFKCGILHEDEEFTPRALLKAKSVKCTNVVFYHYILRENSITTKKDKRKNASDLYQTLCELEKIYLTLENEKLKELLLDSLATKYLYMSQAGKLYKYGKQYVNKDFVKRNAKCSRTVIKCRLYCLSPRLYYFVNNLAKKFL